MVSIKDVAEAAGVSTATVSRVLSNGLHVRPEVRERVIAAVERLGYRPNLVARSLRSQQSSTIGPIVSDISNPFFTAISRTAEDTAYEQGFSVLLCNTDENPEKEAIYLNLMHDTAVAGAIMSPTRQTIASFADSNLPFPIVVVDRSISNGDVDAVLLDNVDAAYRLITHLIERSYRRIAALCREISMQRISDPGRPTRKVILKGQLRVRRSSAPSLVRSWCQQSSRISACPGWRSCFITRVVRNGWRK